MCQRGQLGFKVKTYLYTSQGLQGKKKKQAKSHPKERTDLIL
jgi:hypothetical protein